MNLVPMRLSPTLCALTLALALSPSVHGQATAPSYPKLQTNWCELDSTTSGTADKLMGPLTAANTICFDHYHLKPDNGRPLVLSVKDGDYFHILLGNTDTTLFNYTVTALQPDDKTLVSTFGATGAGVVATRFDDTIVTMRHNRIFERYHVVIALRAGVAPQQRAQPPAPDREAGVRPFEQKNQQTTPPPPTKKLYPATFDVWVRTKRDFEVSFTGGVAFSGLRSPQFFIRTDDQGNDDPADDTSTVEEDQDAKDAFRPDTIAVTNIRFPERLLGIGLAFGVGLNNDADPRYFLGPSYFLGRNVLLTTGWTGGRVDRLPNGQELGEAPIDGATTLNTLGTQFAHGFFVGVSFAFIPEAENTFKGAFGAEQVAGTEEKSGATPPPPPPPVVVTPAEAEGAYSSDQGTATVSREGQTLSVQLPKRAGLVVLATTEENVHSAADGMTSCRFTKEADATGAVIITMTCNEFKGAKAAR